MSDDKKKINTKEVRNIAAAGASGGLLGGIGGAGSSAIDNYKKYKSVKKSYVNKNIDKHIENGMSKNEAYKKLIDEFSKKDIELKKIIPQYSGTVKHKVPHAYIIKAMNEAPYKAIGGAMAGVPIGMLTYGQISNVVDNIKDKKANEMIYFEKITKSDL